MTESGLLSNVAFKAMAAENFVCVRIFSTALGGGHEQIRKFLPGISPELRRSLMYQGNAVVILTPEGKIITPRYEAVEQTPTLTADDVQMEEKIPEALLQLRQVMKRFSARTPATQGIPWQFSPAHALVVAWDDNRRILAALEQDGKIDPDLEKILGQPALLKKFCPRYVFVKVGPEHQVPGEVQLALKNAGPKGLVILDIPPTDVGCFGSGKDTHYRGPWAPVRTAVSGPFTRESLEKLLQEHYIDLPTYVSQGSEKTRKSGRGVRTGLEEFEVLWKAAPASVKKRWTREEVEDLKAYSKQALAEFLR